MFYHILIGNNGKGSFPQEIYELDIDNYDDVVNKYAIPYWRGYKFMIDGYEIDKRFINRFLVKESSTNSHIWLEEVINEGKKHGEIIISNYKNIFNDRNLRSITDEVLEIAKSVPHTQKDRKVMDLPINQNVFIVHGHDDYLKYEVAHFLETYGLKPVILHEQANKGQILIQKLQNNVNEAAFAIVLYSPDDEGRKIPVNEDERKKTDGLQPRARQNVIFEHGLLIGLLGNERVCALVKGEVEKPSDLAGVVYIPYAGNWQMDVLNEIKEAGLEVKF